MMRALRATLSQSQGGISTVEWLDASEGCAGRFVYTVCSERWLLGIGTSVIQLEVQDSCCYYTGC